MGSLTHPEYRATLADPVIVVAIIERLYVVVDVDAAPFHALINLLVTGSNANEARKFSENLLAIYN